MFAIGTAEQEIIFVDVVVQGTKALSNEIGEESFSKKHAGSVGAKSR